MATFSLLTLGFPEIRKNDHPIKLNLRKALALLIYLSENQGAVSRDVLAGLLWPDSPDATARARLRRLRHQIEATLGQHVFEADRASVRWSPRVTLTADFRLFEQASDRGAFEEACQYYRGDFLSGFSLSDCPEFEDWAFFRREALRSRFMHNLERLVQDKNAAGDHFAASAYAARLVECDPLSEVYGRHLIRSLLLAGDRRAAAQHHATLSQRLNDELGIAPEAATQTILDPGAKQLAHAARTPRYTNGAGAYLAYQTYGSGELDILVMPGFVSHVERQWEHPSGRSFLSAMMALGRVVTFDRRGVGLSDRGGVSPTIEDTAKDIGAVLRAAGTRRAVLFGASESGPACVKFAVDEPRLVAGLILFGSLAKGSWTSDYPHVLRASQYDAWRQLLIAEWGGHAGIETFGPSLANDPQARAWWAGLLRAASSPGDISTVLNALRDTDVRHLLSRISSPTVVLHRKDDRAVRIAAGRDLANQIPAAQFVELDGNDHWFFAGDQKPVIETVTRFIGRLTRRGPMQ